MYFDVLFYGAFAIFFLKVAEIERTGSEDQAARLDEAREMYPYLRLATVAVSAALGERRSLGTVGTIRMRVWPGDIDFYPEMNNGRHLTLMDLGRIDLAIRSGLFRLVHSKGWGFVVAGASVRFRHPLKPFRRYDLHTKALGHDGRWFYFLQETEWKGRVYSSVLIRGGIKGREGLMPAAEVLAAMGESGWSPVLPDWVREWIEADNHRVMGGTIGSGE